MQVPIRKPGKYTHQKPDPHLTQAKFEELKAKLERLKNYGQPRAADELRRLAEMGDRSDNFAYSLAKGRLRGINQRILDIEDHLKRAIIIGSNRSGLVQLGSIVTVETGGKQKTYQILGSSETDPTRGVISHHSPIGAALMHGSVGESVAAIINGRKIVYQIIRIE